MVLALLDRILQHRTRGEHVRQTFHRLRKRGLLNDVPGLVFRSGDVEDPSERLIDTGTPRLVQNLDELPLASVGLGLLEPPHRRPTLAARPLAVCALRRHVGMIALVTTHGCKFHCPYCPIPAYNQFTFRWRSPERLRDEIRTIAEGTGVRAFFGTDDNFFNSRATVEEIMAALAKGRVHGRPFRDRIFFGTEATEFDVYKNRDLLALPRRRSAGNLVRDRGPDDEAHQ